MSSRRRGAAEAPLLIERLHALDGDHDDLGWYSRGHHSEKAFRAALAERTQRHPCEAAEAECRFVQGWWRKVPRGDGAQFHAARPGSRGAFPVTALLLPGSEL